MSKKIDTALKALIKALERHAQVVSLKPVPQKKAARVAAQLRAAAADYTNTVEERSGLINPFVDTLDEATLDSLLHERDRLARKHAKDDAAREEKNARKAAKKQGRKDGGNKPSRTPSPDDEGPSAMVPNGELAVAALTPPIPSGSNKNDLHAETLISLRTRAKATGLTGISRLSKAALIERLEQA